eukprot:CAMPEP_0196818614 /NCGR_PEP_ID=MMETSP1362-20130617/66552_1 /TAXON_ID=163516 /ORGANISM="Leptocylindrus danicus, Strain CCMP1856" /LENGTH=360 /DNA_ID=CAMNT_0042196785 /DNA_START=32 /DNA_END=1114 /DNA_ORIENTATION=-
MPPLAVTKPIKVPIRIAMENKAIYSKEETSSSSEEVHAAARATIDKQATHRAHRRSLATHHNTRKNEHSSNQSCDDHYHHQVSEMRIRELLLANVDAILQEAAGPDLLVDSSAATKDVKGEIEHGRTVETIEEEENVPVLKKNTPSVEQEPSADHMDRLKCRGLLKSVLERNKLSLYTSNNSDNSRHDDDVSKAREHITHVHSFLQENYNLFCSYSTMPGIKGKANDCRVAQELEENEANLNASVTNQDVHSREALAKVQDQIDQFYQLALVNMKTGSYHKARQQLLHVLFSLRTRGCAHSDQCLKVCEHLGDLWVLQYKTENAKMIYKNILKIMAERDERPNWEQYAAVRQKLDDLGII